MGKFVYIYYSGKETKDSSNNDAWNKWFEDMGNKLIDVGNPFGGGAQAVHAGGKMDVQGPVATGYTIVEAADMNEATEMAKGCPLMHSKDSAIGVYEALPM